MDRDPSVCSPKSDDIAMSKDVFYSSRGRNHSLFRIPLVEQSVRALAKFGSIDRWKALKFGSVDHSKALLDQVEQR